MQKGQAKVGGGILELLQVFFLVFCRLFMTSSSYDGSSARQLAVSYYDIKFETFLI